MDKQSFTVAHMISLRPKSLYLHCQMPKPTILDMQDKVENRGDEGIKTSILRPLVLQLHQVSSKSDEKQKRFHYRLFNGSVVS